MVKKISGGECGKIRTFYGPVELFSSLCIPYSEVVKKIRLFRGHVLYHGGKSTPSRLKSRLFSEKNVKNTCPEKPFLLKPFCTFCIVIYKKKEKKSVVFGQQMYRLENIIATFYPFIFIFLIAIANVLVLLGTLFTTRTIAINRLHIR